MNITKNTLEAFRKDFKATVKELENQYGIEIDLGSISYDSNEFTAKLEVSNRPTNGLSKEQNYFNQECHYYGLDKSDFKKKVKLDGKEYIIEGINPRGKKYKIILMDVSKGKLITGTSSWVKEGLNK